MKMIRNELEGYWFPFLSTSHYGEDSNEFGANFKQEFLGIVCSDGDYVTFRWRLVL